MQKNVAPFTSNSVLRSSYFLILASCFLLLDYSCRKPVQYSDIPLIKFLSFQKYSDATISDGAILTFYFQDGEGDIGLNQTDIKPPFDTASIFYYNFFCDYYEKQNGVFVKPEIQGNFNARIPRLSSLSSESIDGEIYLKMPTYYDPSSPFDTIRFNFYIVDRKLNKSNIDTTSIIVVKKNKN